MVAVFTVILVILNRSFATRKENSNEKKNSVYVWVLLLWGVLSFFGVRSFIAIIQSVQTGNPLITGILIVKTLFIICFWLNGTKDIVYVFFYYKNRKKRIAEEEKILSIPLDDRMKNFKVLLLYCTCDDFIKESLLESIQQTHQNIDVLILDDSSNEEYKEQINQFSYEHGIKIVRRNDRNGFKAGHLNHFFTNANRRRL